MSLNRIVSEMRKSKKPKKVSSLSPSRMPRNAIVRGRVNTIVPTNRGSSDQKITLNGTEKHLKTNLLLKNESTRGGNVKHNIPFNANQNRVKKNVLITKVQSGTGDVGSSDNAPVTADDDVDLPVWHRTTEMTFESFLHQIDWILSKLQIKGYTTLNCSNSISKYQDICQKLRVEILLALDKLHLLAMPNFKYTKEEGELLHNLNNLKGQLSNLKGQYHSLIKNFGPKVNKIPFR